jgi:hypothetical protein
MQSADSWTALLGKPWLKQVLSIVDYGRETLSIEGRTWSNLGCSYLSEEERVIRSMGAEVYATAYTAQPDRIETSNMQAPDRGKFIRSRITIGSDLEPVQRKQVERLITDFEDVFAIDLADIRACTHTTHNLTVDPSIDLMKKNFGRPLSHPELVAAKEQVDALIKAGIIETTIPEDVKCCSPTVMALKKGKVTELDGAELERLAKQALFEAGLAPEAPPPKEAKERDPPPHMKIKYRLCHNFTQLNKATKVLPFPPGDLESKILKHTGCRWICQMDAIGAFYWIPVSEESKPYLCFHLPGLGYYRYLRLPMGPTGSPGTYQIAMRRTHGDLLDPGPVSDWMDDLFTSSDNFQALLDQMKAILINCRRDGMMLSPEKTALFVSEACLGGVSVSAKGATPSNAKVAALLRWPRPSTAKDVLAFVNTAAVFRGSIPKFATIVKPLYNLTVGVRAGLSDKKRGAYKRALENTPISGGWKAEHKKSFALLKTALCTFPVVVGPKYDGRPFHISTDASAIGVGAHLYQIGDDGEPHTISYASRATNATEKRYHSSKLELLAVKWALDKLRKYVYGQKIVLETDCQAVKDMLRNECMTGVRASWREAITGARIIELVHKAGATNWVADGLSRSHQGYSSLKETTPNWEEEKGVRNSLYDYVAPVRIVTIDEDRTLLEEFEDDENLPMLRYLLQLDNDLTPPENMEDVKRRSSRYWVKGTDLMVNQPGWGSVKVVPTRKGAEIASKEHQITHLGKDLMTSAIARRFWWSSMRKDIGAAIESCQCCCQFGTRLQRLSLKPVLRYAPFDLVAADFLFMPAGDKGHNMIFVTIDCFTRYIEATSFKGTPTSERAINALTSMSERFIMPRALLLDNQFDTKSMKAWGLENNVELLFCAPYAHVGLVENANHLILERLRRNANVDIGHIPSLTQPQAPKRWVQELGRSVSTLNSRKLSFLGGYSPKELLFGPIPSAESPNAVDPATRVLMMSLWRGEATSAMDVASSKRVNDHKTYINYVPELGDLVLVYDASDDRSFQTAAKLKVKWQGPFIVQALRKGSVKVTALCGRPKEGWVGMGRLKRWRPSAEVVCQMKEQDGEREEETVEGEEGDKGGEEGE